MRRVKPTYTQQQMDGACDLAILLAEELKGATAMTPAIHVTEAMIEAGVAALRERVTLRFPHMDAPTVEAIYLAMHKKQVVTPDVVERVARALRDESDRQLNANSHVTYPLGKVENYIKHARAAIIAALNMREASGGEQ